MIKLLIFVILILVLAIVYRLCRTENFHEKTNAVSNEPEVLQNCVSCSFCDFKPNPESKDYIISRCLLQHTQTGAFKPTNSGCKDHRDLAISSGCNVAINHYIQNIENLKAVNDATENRNCKCMYLIDDTSAENQSYNAWINSF